MPWTLQCGHSSPVVLFQICQTVGLDAHDRRHCCTPNVTLWEGLRSHCFTPEFTTGPTAAAKRAGACRFHYGHPDVWRRSFVSICGGVSKANKSLHVSEDVFGGYNVMLRGRDVKYVDYIAVGKGRDMGFETINTFEAKVGRPLARSGGRSTACAWLSCHS